MHAVRGITTPPSATMSDGISTTTMTIIEILSQISDPVTEVQNYPPATQFRDESRFHRGRVRLSSGNKDHTQSGATRENGGRNKDKYSNRTTKETANQHLLDADRKQSVYPVLPRNAICAYLVVPHHLPLVNTLHTTYWSVKTHLDQNIIPPPANP